MHQFASLIGLDVDQLQHHPSLIVNAFDREHRVTFWNDNCATHFGIPADKAVGQKLEDILPWAKADERTIYLDRALCGVPMQIMHVPFKMKHGYYDQRVLPLKDEAGNVIGVLNVVEPTMG